MTSAAQVLDDALVRPTPDRVTAFEDIYRRYERRAVLLARRLTRDDRAGEDVAQEAFLRVLKHLDTFDSSRPVWPWLKTIVTNAAIDYHRRQSHAPALSLVDQPALDDDYLRLEDRRALVAALSAIPTRERTALTLRYLHDWDSKDTAEFLGLSTPAMDQLLHRARARLRKEYERAASVAGKGLRVVFGPLAVRAAARVRRARARIHEAAGYMGITGFSALATTVANVALAATMATVVATSARSTHTVPVTWAPFARTTGASDHHDTDSPSIGVRLQTLGASKRTGANREIAIHVQSGTPRSLVELSASGGVSRNAQRATLNSEVWSRIGDQPAVAGIAPYVDCDSAVREKVCAAVGTLPSTSTR